MKNNKNIIFIAVIFLFSCKTKIENQWLVPEQNQYITDKDLLKKGFVEDIDNSCYRYRKTDSLGTISYYFYSQKTLLSFQDWTIKGNFNSLELIKEYLQNYNISYISEIKNRDYYLFSHNHYHYLYNVFTYKDSIAISYQSIVTPKRYKEYTSKFPNSR